MRNITFTPQAFKEYNDWIHEDIEVVHKLILLLREIQKDPFRGIGKPEPLKGNFSGCWSRRITSTHRLIYKISNDHIEIIKCRDHY
jgi:toxin YoeB